MGRSRRTGGWKVDISWKAIMFAQIVVIMAALLSAALSLPRDMFGRAMPHGEPVGGAFIGLHATRTNLGFGQPLTVGLFEKSAGPDGPHINVRTGDRATLKYEMT